jgi:predicted aspartyl protease
MGIMYVMGTVRRPDGSGPSRRIRFLVDTGAVYTVLPKDVCAALALSPKRSVDFTLADGTAITRGVSECEIDLGGHAATSAGDPRRSGRGSAARRRHPLETLGMMVNPLSRRLLPMRMVLAGFSAPA